MDKQGILYSTLALFMGLPAFDVAELVPLVRNSGEEGSPKNRRVEMLSQ